MLQISAAAPCPNSSGNRGYCSVSIRSPPFSWLPSCAQLLVTAGGPLLQPKPTATRRQIFSLAHRAQKLGEPAAAPCWAADCHAAHPADRHSRQSSLSPHHALVPRQGCVQDKSKSKRGFATLKPKFVGGKLKTYSSFKQRFKMTANGKILRFRPGHRHKRVVKSGRQNRELGSAVVVHPTFATIMKHLGFKRRSFA